MPIHAEMGAFRRCRKNLRRRLAAELGVFCIKTASSWAIIGDAAIWGS
jgi:hypothetical protein